MTISTFRHNDTQITTFGKIDERSLQQLKNCVEAGKEVPYAVLCADHHPGYSQPIGAAIGYVDQISPSGVGYDIGCGNLAIKTNLDYYDVAPDLDKIMDEIQNRISFGVGRKNNEPVNSYVFDQIANASFVPQRSLLQLAKDQLGTVGSGNHYVDLFKDSSDDIWIGIHFGSRGFGHKTASGFLAMAQGKKFDERGIEGEMDSPPILFDVKSQIGQDYIAAMQLAGEYAYAGRQEVGIKVLKILGAQYVDLVHNHHNFAWQEEHFGQALWVVRKGCTPAWPEQQGFIGSTMGGTSLIVKGKASVTSANALFSTVHGAGRVMSRRAAAGKQKWVNGQKVTVKPGLVDYNQVRTDLTAQGIIIRGGGPDEAPEVYKDLLKDVIVSHLDTLYLENTLEPIGVVMAGSDEFDPYKD